jgi:hypothetical protein
MASNVLTYSLDAWLSVCLKRSLHSPHTVYVCRCMTCICTYVCMCRLVDCGAPFDFGWRWPMLCVCGWIRGFFVQFIFLLVNGRIRTPLHPIVQQQYSFVLAPPPLHQRFQLTVDKLMMMKTCG